MSETEAREATITIDPPEDDPVDVDVTATEARALALLIGTGLCHVSIEADGYRPSVVDRIKTTLQGIV